MEKKIVKDIGKRKFLRSSKNKLFIINEAKPAITCLQLPTGMDVLQHIVYRRSLLPHNVKKSAILSCTPYKIQGYKRCEVDDCECILGLIKRPWLKAGFQVMSDKSIIKNLMKMDKKYSDLSRNKCRGTARDKVNQGEFISFLKKLFWIGSTDLKNQIRKDKKRSDNDKHDDFFG
nr:uncharacterized protein LOC124806843 [Hydra vulgaris]